MPRNLERTDVEGIPVLWAETPGAFRAALLFRVGIADETPPKRGITHLVEHLALFGSSSRSYDANGFVDLERCVLYASGDRDDVLGWLRRCAAALADLPLDRLATERRILRAEAASAQGGGVLSRMLDLRFGGCGYGLCNYVELGLRWLGEEDVSRWARTRFNRGNAVLWMNDEPPATLDLALPDGERIPPPPVDPLPGRGRRFVADGTGGVAVGGLGKRSTALNAALTIAHERLYQRLRVDLGLVYEPWSSYETLGPDDVHVLMGAECPDERAGRVADEVWRVVGEIAEDGVTPEEIADHHKRMARLYDEPDSVFAELDHWASHELLGAARVDTDKVLGDLDEMDPREPGRALEEAFADALYMVPAGTERVDGFERFEADRPDPVGGSAYAYEPQFYGPGYELRVGDRGVTVIRHELPPLTLLWDEIVLAEWAPADTLVLMARDGSWLELHFAAIRGEGARSDVLAHLPAGLVIPAGNLEATEALNELVERMPAEAEVAAELAALPRELGEDEVPEAVLQYRHGDHRGLLALTNERLIRWYLGTPESDGEAIPREAIRRAEVRKRLLRPPVLVVEHEKELELTVDDVEGAEDLAARLEPPADG
jgi:zinc protease